MKPIKLIVKTHSEKYPIIIGRNLISNLSKIFKKNSFNFKKCLLVLDKNIPSKYIKQISKSLYRYEVYKFIYNPFEKKPRIEITNKPTALETKTNISLEERTSPSSLAFSNLRCVGSWVFSWDWSFSATIPTTLKN